MSAEHQPEGFVPLSTHEVAHLASLATRDWPPTPAGEAACARAMCLMVEQEVRVLTHLCTAIELLELATRDRDFQCGCGFIDGHHECLGKRIEALLTAWKAPPPPLLELRPGARN